MFPKKAKNKEADLVAEQVHRDLIVHNMPDQAKLLGFNYSLSESGQPTSEISQTNNFSDVNKSKSNFKIVGLLIIGGSLIVVAALVYASYYFIIKPTAKNSQTELAPINQKENSLIATTTATTTVNVSPIAVNPATIDLVATVSPLTLGTSTASTTMSEELLGLIDQNLPPLVDTDQDGLNDDEELLLGTTATSTDSDSDGYTDFAELNNSYNPAGSGLLKVNSQLAEYLNNTVNYQILYPKSWSVKALNGDYTVIFTAPDNSLIQISVQDNSDKQSILAWYENSFLGSTVTYDKLKSSTDWDGVMGDDNLNFYVTDKQHNNIYVISYIPAVDDRLVYPNIFKLMINSLILK